jgi:hypothetical protein
MRRLRNLAFVVMVAVGGFTATSGVVGARFECDPDDMFNQDCGPQDVCDPGTLTCTSECNHNPSQCQPGWTCPVAEPSGCVPIG